MEGSKAADGAKRQATAAASKRVDARPSRLPNGTSEKVRDADKDSQKEWMYEDKVGHCMYA